MTSRLIQDAGDFIPNARKHLAQPTGVRFAGRETRLGELFPEPDWGAMVAQGRPVDCVARLAMVYESLASGPKADGLRGMSGDFWEAAYVEAIGHLKEFFEHATTLEQAKGCARWMAGRIGLTPHTVIGRPLEHVGVYWAAGRGGAKSFHPPGSLTPRQGLFATWLPRLGWPHSDDCLRASVVPVELADGRFAVGVVKGASVSQEFEPTTSIEQAVMQAREFAASQLAAAARVKVRRGSCDAVRLGPNVLPNGVEVTPELLIAKFRFRGVQFGEYVPQSERRAWMTETYCALMDLSHVTGLAPARLGLGGLGLAIGARGEKGSAAHFEPALKVVNFTRHRGAGALAHEWFHALDNALAVEPGSTSLLETCDAEAMFRLDPKTYAGATGAAVDYCRGLVAGLRASAMRKQAIRIGKLPRARSWRYWASMEEMGARAFEAWVEDTLAANGRCSPFLVAGTLERDNPRPEVSPYPVGEERAQIRDAMAGLVAILRDGSRRAA